MSIYMLGMIKNLDAKVFIKSLIQGSIIAFIVFMMFAWGGEAIFSKYLNLRFEAFQIFGGLIFLVIGYRFVFQGADTVGEIRGDAKNLAGTVAMPFMIGPGTISAAVVTGLKMPIGGAAGVIGLTLVCTCSVLILMKLSHDFLRHKHAQYIDYYVEVVGRLSALLVGSIAVDMIISGVLGVIEKMPS